MVSNCKECKMFAKCPAIPAFTNMIREFAEEEKVDLSALSASERHSYINDMVDQWIKYVKGHVTASLMTYAREVLVG